MPREGVAGQTGVDDAAFLASCDTPSPSMANGELMAHRTSQVQPGVACGLRLGLSFFLFGENSFRGFGLLPILYDSGAPKHYVTGLCFSSFPVSLSPSLSLYI